MSSDLPHSFVSPPVREPALPAPKDAIDLANRYVARILQQHLVANPDIRHWTARGSAVLADISGFTKLSERLARKGREGAEQITDAIGSSFDSVLEVAYDNGGSLLKFGGDALLLWFTGDEHVERACRATLEMRQVLRDLGRVEVTGANIMLRMSQAVHSGEFHFFAVGTSHIELLPTGPAWSRLIALQQAAQAGEILLSNETAALLPARCAGKPREPGWRRKQATPDAAPEDGLRGSRPLPFSGDPRARAQRRRHVGASPGHDSVHPL